MPWPYWWTILPWWRTAIAQPGESSLAHGAKSLSTASFWAEARVEVKKAKDEDQCACSHCCTRQLADS
jgi:hypothetical protein